MDRKGVVILPKVEKSYRGQICPLLEVSVIRSMATGSIKLDSCYLCQKIYILDSFKPKNTFFGLPTNMCSTNSLTKHGHS